MRDRPEGVTDAAVRAALADIAAYTAGLRRPDGPGGDAEDALTNLEANLGTAR